MLKRLLFSSFFVALFCCGARAEYFTITDYSVKVVFTEEGYADFEEVIEVAFTEPRHGIFRKIPLRSLVDGKKTDRILRDIRVEGFDFTTSKEGGNLIIKIGDSDVWVEGTQTYRIRYRVLNPLNFFAEHSEFYWDLLGTAWPVVTENFAFDLRFPGRIDLNDGDVRCFTGAKGSVAQDAEFQVASNQVSGRATQKLMPEEGLTLAVKLPKTAFEAMDSWTYFRMRHGLLLAPFYFLIAGFLAVWMARNRRQNVPMEQFPPEGISPAVAGGFVDNSVDTLDVLSLIPYLADKGYLLLETGEGDDVVFIKLKTPGPELLPFEKQFLEALFSDGDRVELKSLRNKFHTHIVLVQAAVKQWIREQGWYEPDQRAMGCTTALAALGALIWGGIAIFKHENLDGIALLVTGIVMFVLAGRFNKRTAAGNETYQKLEGFRQFVLSAQRPEVEKLAQRDPRYYDKTMAYALAFGRMTQWNAYFDGLLSNPPAWHRGSSRFGLQNRSGWNSFAESFPNEMETIGSVFNSRPSSSSSSGGGSSGGGSGGGGGGSW